MDSRYVCKDLKVVRPKASVQKSLQFRLCGGCGTYGVDGLEHVR